jgi:hypothetical protein
MSAASDYLENELLDHVLDAAAFSSPSNVYLALFTADTGLETNSPSAECKTPGVDGYSRATLSFAAASGGSSATDAAATVGPASANWGTISHIAVVDHDTNTTWGTNVNVLFYGAVTATKTIDSGDTFQISSGNLTVTLA